MGEGRRQLNKSDYLRAFFNLVSVGQTSSPHLKYCRCVNVVCVSRGLVWSSRIFFSQNEFGPNTQGCLGLLPTKRFASFDRCLLILRYMRWKPLMECGAMSRHCDNKDSTPTQHYRKVNIRFRLEWKPEPNRSTKLFNNFINSEVGNQKEVQVKKSFIRE